MPVYGKRSTEIKQGLHHLLIAILDEAIKDPPYDFGLHDGHRSLEKQLEYFKAKKSTIDGINRRGYHNYLPALAFDFHCSVKGNTWDNEKKEVDGDPAYLEEIARHIQEVAKKLVDIKLVWGGDWINFVDAPHIQMPFKFKYMAEKKKLYVNTN